MPKSEYQTPDEIREARERVEAEKRALLDRIARAERRQKEKAHNGTGTPIRTPSRHSPGAREQGSPSGAASIAVETPTVEMEAPAVVTMPEVSPSIKDREISASLSSRRSNSLLDDAYQVKMRKQAELDADVASNESKMDELRRQMRALEEENRRKIQDRDNLARELESLGVDTVGMSHTDLQATKELIESQMVQNNDDVIMADVDARTDAGAEPERSLVEYAEEEKLSNSPSQPVIQSDVGVQKSDLEDGEWRSSEIGNSPAGDEMLNVAQDLAPSYPLPNPHSLGDPSSKLPETQAEDIPDGGDLYEVPSQHVEADQRNGEHRPNTADSFNSLSSGEIIEDDTDTSLHPSEPSEPQRQTIQEEEEVVSSSDILAKHDIQQEVKPNYTADEVLAKRAPVEQTSADESHGDEDYEPEITINDSAPAESVPSISDEPAKVCHDIFVRYVKCQ
jgi:hypothetical protein